MPIMRRVLQIYIMDLSKVMKVNNQTSDSAKIPKGKNQTLFTESLNFY